MSVAFRDEWPLRENTGTGGWGVDTGRKQGKGEGLRGCWGREKGRSIRRGMNGICSSPTCNYVLKKLTQLPDESVAPPPPPPAVD